MEFFEAFLENRRQAAQLGIRLRPVAGADALEYAHRVLSGSRVSDGFFPLADKGRLELTVEALAVDKRFTALFSDREANEALARLLSAGWPFPKK